MLPSPPKTTIVPEREVAALDSRAGGPVTFSWVHAAPSQIQVSASVTCVDPLLLPPPKRVSVGPRTELDDDADCELELDPDRVLDPVPLAGAAAPYSERSLRAPHATSPIARVHHAIVRFTPPL